MAKGQRVWTEEELLLLEQMRVDGYTYSEVSERLGRSVKSIESKCCREELPRVYSTRERYLELMLCDPPQKESEIAKSLGITLASLGTIRWRWRKQGLDIPPAAGAKWRRENGKVVECWRVSKAPCQYCLKGFIRPYKEQRYCSYECRDLSRFGTGR